MRSPLGFFASLKMNCSLMWILTLPAAERRAAELRMTD